MGYRFHEQQFAAYAISLLLVSTVPMDHTENKLSNRLPSAEGLQRVDQAL